MNDTDAVAAIIQSNTHIVHRMEEHVSIPYKQIDGKGLIDALADHFDAQHVHEYYPMTRLVDTCRCGHGEDEPIHKIFDRASFVAKCKGEPNG